jgi:hypothetical protein
MMNVKFQTTTVLRHYLIQTFGIKRAVQGAGKNKAPNAAFYYIAIEMSSKFSSSKPKPKASSTMEKSFLTPNPP